ncbi:MAG: restriction endonuclease subunit S [Phycisphaerales bacterium]|nr:restriction endonuclease subunit S [Phycisphaerales bacterium]
MNTALKDITQVHFGYYTQPIHKGTIIYLQAKHFNDSGLLTGNQDTFLEEDEKITEHLLQAGDVLFAAKGFRFFATLYKPELGKAVASSIFFVIKPNLEKILPAYLVSVLNLPKNQSYFQQAGAGSSIPSIRKSELMDFTFNLIPLAQQQHVVTLQDLYFKDIALTENLIKQKQRLFQSALSKIIQ